MIQPQQQRQKMICIATPFVSGLVFVLGQTNPRVSLPHGLVGTSTDKSAGELSKRQLCSATLDAASAAVVSLVELLVNRPKVEDWESENRLADFLYRQTRERNGE
jgi:hypothetical protein